MDVKTTRKGGSPIIVDLSKRLQEFSGKQPLINGAVTLPSDEFPYWWYLEFGTGQYYQADANDAGLPRPLSVASVQGRSGPYPIAPRNSLSGLNKKRRLKFTMFGDTYYRLIVMHPGSRPANRGRGMVRIAAHQANKELNQKIRGFRRRKSPPTREELVNAVNGALIDAFVDIKRLTPVDPDSPHPSHLRDAWSFRRAE